MGPYCSGSRGMNKDMIYVISVSRGGTEGLCIYSVWVLGKEQRGMLQALAPGGRGHGSGRSSEVLRGDRETCHTLWLLVCEFGCGLRRTVVR